MPNDFEEFISQFTETNATLDYFTDFNKIKNNVNKIAIKLNQLNYLIGKSDLKTAIKELYEENPKRLKFQVFLLPFVTIKKPKL